MGLHASTARKESRLTVKGRPLLLDVRRDITAAVAHKAAGWRAMMEKRFDDALEHFKLAVQADPVDPGLRFKLAEAHVALEHWSEAQGILNAATLAIKFFHHDFDFVDIYYLFGMCAARNTRGDDVNHAIQALQSVNRSDLAKMVYADAMKHYEASLKNDPLPVSLLSSISGTQVVTLKEHQMPTKVPTVARPRSTEWRSLPGMPRSPEVVIPFLKRGLDPHSAIEFRHGPNGFGVFAKRTLKANEVFFIEKPLVTAPISPATQCEYCLHTFVNNQPVTCATGCTALFCSADCRNSATLEYHGALCGMDMREIFNRYANGLSSTSSTGVLATKIVGIALVHARTQGLAMLSCQPADMPYLSSLMRPSDSSHVERSTDNRPLLFYSDMIKAATKAVSAAFVALDETKAVGFCRLILDPFLDVEAFAVLCDLLQWNSICYGGYRDTGVAMLVAGSMFNHSCANNATWFTNVKSSSVFSFKTLQDVRAGEELCISYMSSGMPLQQRMLACKVSYGFVCKCPRCKSAPEYTSAVDFVNSLRLRTNDSA